ncbi:MAG: nucleotidyltransferase domain-containing protein [bacterium]
MDEVELYLRDIVDRLVREFNPEKIILFGSYAWGSPNSASDLDIFVIVKISELSPTKRAAKAYRCLQGLKMPAEVIVSTRKKVERYRSVPSSLTRKIMERGKVLYG